MNSNQFLNAIEDSFIYSATNIYKFDLIRVKKNFIKFNEKLEEYALGGGKHSSRFNEIKREIANYLCKKIELGNIIRSREYIRPLFSLYSDPIFFAKYRLNMRVLSAVDGMLRGNPLTTIGLRGLCNVYFMNYENFRELSEPFTLLIKNQLLQYKSHRKLFGLTKFRAEADNIFSISGPEWFAKEALKKQCSITELLDSYTIPQGSSYYSSASYHFIFEQLRKLKANENSQILDRVTDKKLYDTIKDNNGRLLGHDIIETLIKKLHEAHVVPSERWKNTILAIAGDPRVSESSPRYRKWWAIVKKEYLVLMRSWLSKFDMELFLNIIEQFCEHDPKKERMFKERKKFLSHIFEKNDVLISWLFIGLRAEELLRRTLKKEEIPNFTKLKGGGDVVFYYQVGNAHVIEGAHSFTMKILDNIPNNSPILRFESEIHIGELRTKLAERYAQQFKNTNDGYHEIVHSVNWKIRAISILKRYGVSIDITKICTEDEYIQYYRGS